MLVNSLKKVINYFGSTTKVARALGTQQQSVSDWYRGRSEVPLDIALHLGLLMHGEVHWKDFVPFEIAYRLKDLCLSLKEAGAYPCELTHILTNRINVPESLKSIKTIEKNPSATDRPPCINDDYTLIFGYEAFSKHQKNNKKTIPCWKLSLENLAEGNYVASDLVKAFLISERVAVGIALEAFIGKHQGYRTDLQKNKQNGDFEQGLREKFPEVKEKRTLAIVAYLLGFGDNHRKIYEQAKNVFQLGCYELIELVDQKKLVISKAAKLAKLSHEEQKRKLVP